MAAAARVEGQEKVIAAAQQIVKSLATSKTAADDMIRILSGFDNRFSLIDHGLFTQTGDVDAADAPDASEASGTTTPCEAEALLDAGEKVLLRWDAADSLLWESSSPNEISEYLAAVDGVISLTSAASGDVRGRAESLLQIAMSRLEEEFRFLLFRNTVPLDSNGLYCSIRRLSLSFASDSGSATEDFETFPGDESPQLQCTARHESSFEESFGSMDSRNVDLIRPEAVPDLREIADRMIWSDYGKELAQVYCTVRREILDDCLAVVGVDRMSIEEVQRIGWTALDDKMNKWIQAVRNVIGVLLPGERRLCDQIFAASEELREECFIETAKGCVMQLLNFGDAVAICPRSSEKLFRILDMYEALAEVMPDLQALFSGDPGGRVYAEAEGILERLGNAVRGTLAEFGNAVQRETSRRQVLGGEIHPVTRYVMNYSKLLVAYSDTLDVLLDECGGDGGDRNHPEEGESDDSCSTGRMTPLGRRLLWLISYLESNLEEKAKFYEDDALQYIFLLNNLLYIVQKVKDSELGKLLGALWVRRRRGQIRQYATSYLRASWTKVLSCLKDDGLGSWSSNSSLKMALKDRFKNFNLAFEEIYRVQTAWKVPDPQLREELRISISEKVIPAYRSFMGRFGSQLEGGRHAAKYIKYTPKDLECNLSDLFEGSSGLSNHPRKNVSS